MKKEKDKQTKIPICPQQGPNGSGFFRVWKNGRGHSWSKGEDRVCPAARHLSTQNAP